MEAHPRAQAAIAALRHAASGSIRCLDISRTRDIAACHCPCAAHAEMTLWKPQGKTQPLDQQKQGSTHRSSPIANALATHDVVRSHTGAFHIGQQDESFLPQPTGGAGLGNCSEGVRVGPHTRTLHPCEQLERMLPAAAAATRCDGARVGEHIRLEATALDL